MINWKVRIKNPRFWAVLIPALLLLAQQVAALFGFDLELTVLGQDLVRIVSTVFTVLALVGIVQDPTTAGLRDSTRAMLYDEPFEEATREDVPYDEYWGRQ